MATTFCIQIGDHKLLYLILLGLGLNYKQFGPQNKIFILVKCSEIKS